MRTVPRVGAPAWAQHKRAHTTGSQRISIQNNGWRGFSAVCPAWHNYCCQESDRTDVCLTGSCHAKVSGQVRGISVGRGVFQPVLGWRGASTAGDGRTHPGRARRTGAKRRPLSPASRFWQRWALPPMSRWSGHQPEISQLKLIAACWPGVAGINAGGPFG